MLVTYVTEKVLVLFYDVPTNKLKKSGGIKKWKMQCFVISNKTQDVHILPKGKRGKYSPFFI